MREILIYEKLTRLYARIGQELEGMSDVLKDVYGSNFGESMEDAAAGITSVYQATGLTEDALAETTKAAYALSDTFGYDIAESARAAKAMMTNFGVSGEEAMGLIAAGAQNGLDYSGELIDSISEYSVQFSKSYPLYIEGQRFGPPKLMLKSVDVSDVLLSNTGKFLQCAVALQFEEYANVTAASTKPVTSTKPTATTPSATKAADVYNSIVAQKNAAFGATAQPLDRAAKKPTAKVALQ